MIATQYDLNDDIVVFYIAAESFPEGITAAFDKLEATITDLSDRHIYGITECTGDKLAYMACAKAHFNNEGIQYGLPTYIIPKGKYWYYTLDNWRENLQEIPKLFARFENAPSVKKQTICVEDYIAPYKMLAMVHKA